MTLTAISEIGIDMMDLHVGPSKTHFHVHKKLLCSKSKYFDAMFNGGFKETEEQAATLPEDGPVIIGHFLKWVYCGTLPPLVPGQPHRHLSNDRIKLYAFAEKICETELTDYVITNLVSKLVKHNVFSAVSSMLLAYNITPLGSKLRSIMIFQLLRIVTIANPQKWPTSQITEALNESTDMNSDLVAALRGSHEKPIGSIMSDDFDICEFHVHPEGKENCRNKKLEK